MGFFNFKREIKWDKDVMKVTDSMSNIWDSVVHEMSDKIKDEQTEEVLRHFDIDMSELREYLRDKEEWRRKQEAAIPKWIPVTERLPDKRQLDVYGPISSSKVLFKTSDKTIHLGYLIEDSYVDAYAGEIILFRWYDDHGERVENVTKWCEPPKEESK